MAVGEHEAARAAFQVAMLERGEGGFERVEGACVGGGESGLGGSVDRGFLGRDGGAGSGFLAGVSFSGTS